MKDLSIIIPVYNVENYIRACLLSVFRQNLKEDSFEVIVVDDGSEDDSIERIKDIIDQHSNITVVSQINQGLSAARNTGLKNAIGRYVLFLDSDDLLVDGCLSELLISADNYSVDLLIADFVKLSDQEIGNTYSLDNHSCQPLVLNGREAFVHYLNPSQCYVWRTFYRKSFLENNNIIFIPGIYFEDIPFTIECYLKIKKALVYPLKFYIYRQHPNSIVSSVNKKKLLDFNRVLAHLSLLKMSAKLTEIEDFKFSDVLFSTFSIEMWYLIHVKGMFVYRKEIVEDLKKRAPNLCFYNGYKQKIVSILYRYIPYVYLWTRFLLGK